MATIWCSKSNLSCHSFAVGTTVIIKIGKQKYMLITILPMAFISVITLWASTVNIFTNYMPNHKTALTMLSFKISKWPPY